jgi:hypothetical protein
MERQRRIRESGCDLPLRPDLSPATLLLLWRRRQRRLVREAAADADIKGTTHAASAALWKPKKSLEQHHEHFGKRRPRKIRVRTWPLPKGDVNSAEHPREGGYLSRYRAPAVLAAAGRGAEQVSVRRTGSAASRAPWRWRQPPLSSELGVSCIPPAPHRHERSRRRLNILG